MQLPAMKVYFRNEPSLLIFFIGRNPLQKKKSYMVAAAA